jgi:hypothetical protein
MSKGIDYCPFCGDEDCALREIRAEQLDHVTYWVQCPHCGARGGTFIEDTAFDERWEIAGAAIENWNEARRLTWWELRVKKPIRQFFYDTRLCVENWNDRS